MPYPHETDRLYFDMMTEQDSALMLDLDSDPEVMRYITHGEVTSAAKMRDYYIPRMKSYTNPEKGWGLWKTFRKEDDQFIGWFLLRPYKKNPTEIEIGWRFKRKFWGKGYGTEGASYFRDQLFGEQTLLGCATKIVAIAMPGNKGSIGIMKKIGMTYVTTYREDDPIIQEDVVLYELPSSDRK